MIYFLRSPETGLIKIGTTRDYHTRLSHLIMEYGDLELLGLMDGSYEEETALHHQFAEVRQGRSEWFEKCPELMAYIADGTHLNLPPKWMFVNLDDDVLHWVVALKDAMGVKNVSEALRRALKERYPNIEELARQAERKDSERQQVLSEFLSEESESE